MPNAGVSAFGVSASAGNPDGPPRFPSAGCGHEIGTHHGLSRLTPLRDAQEQLLMLAAPLVVGEQGLGRRPCHVESDQGLTALCPSTGGVSSPTIQMPISTGFLSLFLACDLAQLWHQGQEH